MPLARIFTRYPERAAALSEQLQQQGYRVEVSSPDQAHLPPADLEIEFEICDRADVLERAAQLAEELQADVAVAPGVLQPQTQPAAEPLPAVNAQGNDSAVVDAQALAAVLPMEAAAQAPMDVVMAELSAVEPETAELSAGAEPLPAVNAQADDSAVVDAQALAAVLPMEAAAQAPMDVVMAELSAVEPETTARDGRDREREFEEAFQADRVQRMHESEHESAVEEPLPTAVEHQAIEEALPPVAMLEEEPSAMRATPVGQSIEQPAIETAEPVLSKETVRPADPVPYLAQLTPFSKPAEHAQTEAAEYRSGQAYEVSHQPAGDKPAQEGVGGNLASIFSTAMTGLKSASASAAESFRERVQEYKKRAQVHRAETHAARVARMLDLEQRKAEAHQRATELEAAREAASARLVELVRERQPGLSEEDRKLQSQRTPLDSLRHASIASMRTRPRRPMSPQWRMVMTGAAAMTILFVIWIVLSQLSPHTPAAATANHASSNNGVTIQTGNTPAQSGGVTLQTGSPAAQPVAAPKPSASTAQTPAAQKPSPRVSTARRVAAAQGEEEVGDDVVIRHYSRPAPTEKPKQSGQQAGLKHFSDMEN